MGNTTGIETFCKVTDAELGWFAGIIDGEGTITIRKRFIARRDVDPLFRPYFEIYMMVANTDFRMLDKLVDLSRRISGGKTRIRPVKLQKNCRPARAWYASSAASYAILRAIHGLLVCKREQALLAMEMMNRIKTRKLHTHWRTKMTREEAIARVELFTRMKALNKRGAEGRRFPSSVLMSVEMPKPEWAAKDLF
jgi:hypothetical protein